MFNLAQIWGWRSEGLNPVRHIEKYKAAKRDGISRPMRSPALSRPGGRGR
jgi:hypothetical protein